MNRLVLSKSPALKLAKMQFPRMLSQNIALNHKAVIFDMGGVLIESPVQIFRAYEENHRLPNNALASLVFEGEKSGNVFHAIQCLIKIYFLYKLANYSLIFWYLTENLIRPTYTESVKLTTTGNLFLAYMHRSVPG